MMLLMERMARGMSDLEEEKEEFRKGPWTLEENMKLIDYVSVHGPGRWDSVAKAAGLKRSGRSCRMKWVNYLCPDLKRGSITPEEESLIIDLHSKLGNRWSRIAQSLPGRTDNEVKNYWRSHVKKKSPGCSWPPMAKPPAQMKKTTKKNSAASNSKSFITQTTISLQHHQKDRKENCCSDSPMIINQVSCDLHNCMEAPLNFEKAQNEESDMFKESSLCEDSPVSSSPMDCFSGNHFFWDYNSLQLWDLNNDIHDHMCRQSY